MPSLDDCPQTTPPTPCLPRNRWLLCVGITGWLQSECPAALRRNAQSGCDHRLGQRRVLSWRLSNSLTAGFCVEALSEALGRFGKPEVFNSDQGSQFTSEEFTRVLLEHRAEISMDGRGRCHDNIFVERLWWTVLRPAANGLVQKRSLAEFFDWYNHRRPHQALGWQTPDEAYFGRFGAVVVAAA
jgi:putative transposase